MQPVYLALLLIASSVIRWLLLGGRWQPCTPGARRGWRARIDTDPTGLRGATERVFK